MRLISFFILFSLFSLSSYAQPPKVAPVAGFARSFIFGSAISNAEITILETEQKLKTDNEGHFGPFNYPVGKPITLLLKKWNYKTTQSATIIVPPEGLLGPYNQITFQVPSVESYYILRTIIGGKEDANSCHVATTITAYGKTMDDDPQGEENAYVTFTPHIYTTPFYFDIFKSGPLEGKTNPFTKGLKNTSEDGGVLLFNLPAQDKLYTLSAQKAGLKFTKVKFWCRKGAFINISPPRGPTASK